MAAGRKALGQKLVRNRRLGELLVEEGYITEEQLGAAVEEQAATGGMLGRILVTSGYVTEWEVAKCLVAQLQLPFVYTALYDIPKEAVDLLPHAFLHQHLLVPVDLFGKCLALATCGNISQEVVEEIELSTRLEVMLYVSLASDIQTTLEGKFALQKVANELSEKFDELFK